MGVPYFSRFSATTVTLHFTSVTETTHAQYEKVVEKASDAFLVWRTIPAPQRGDIVRQFG